MTPGPSFRSQQSGLSPTPTEGRSPASVVSPTERRILPDDAGDGSTSAALAVTALVSPAATALVSPSEASASQQLVTVLNEASASQELVRVPRTWLDDRDPAQLPLKMNVDDLVALRSYYGSLSRQAKEKAVLVLVAQALVSFNASADVEISALDVLQFAAHHSKFTSAAGEPSREYPTPQLLYALIAGQTLDDRVRG
jgi:hypothetical protein